MSSLIPGLDAILKATRKLTRAVNLATTNINRWKKILETQDISDNQRKALLHNIGVATRNLKNAYKSLHIDPTDIIDNLLDGIGSDVG